MGESNEEQRTDKEIATERFRELLLEDAEEVVIRPKEQYDKKGNLINKGVRIKKSSFKDDDKIHVGRGAVKSMPDRKPIATVPYLREIEKAIDSEEEDLEKPYFKKGEPGGCKDLQASERYEPLPDRDWSLGDLKQMAMEDRMGLVLGTGDPREKSEAISRGLNDLMGEDKEQAIQALAESMEGLEDREKKKLIRDLENEL